GEVPLLLVPVPHVPSPLPVVVPAKSASRPGPRFSVVAASPPVAARAGGFASSDELIALGTRIAVQERQSRLPVGRAELVDDGRDVTPPRHSRDGQAGRDLRRRSPVAQKVEHLPFAC